MTHPVRIQPAEQAYRALNNPVQPAACGPDVLATLATVNVDGDVGKELLMPPRGLFVGVTTLDVVQRVARRPGVDEKVV
ncbi:MAG TPA: hypothetical protein VHH53_03315, partial [Pseudonocardiaceae bacterium]|nr:hypothetical protein [Pseudonocardiaceae bacterium]